MVCPKHACPPVNLVLIDRLLSCSLRGACYAMSAAKSCTTPLLLEDNCGASRFLPVVQRSLDVLHFGFFEVGLLESSLTCTVLWGEGNTSTR